MKVDAPYLSIVATTRNDNHGGDLLKRTTAFVKGIYHQATQHNLPLELIIVEWNPPPNKPLLKEVLPLPEDTNPVMLRFIIVPNEIQQQFRFSEEIPLFQMIAKNVGIRRAKGEFILCTNIDLLFSDQLFTFLAKQNLNKDSYYRANRCDIPKDVLEIDNFNKQLQFAHQNVLSRLGKNPDHEFIFGLPRFMYAFTYTMKALNVFYKNFVRLVNKRGDYQLYTLDTEACGDFTLMHRDAWHAIEGYVELDLYSIHIDSMALIAAKALGFQQEILPSQACTYHIYHEDGWASFRENPVLLFKFIEKKPGVDWFTVYETGKWLIKNHRGWQLNDANWGMANREFEECIF